MPTKSFALDVLAFTTSSASSTNEQVLKSDFSTLLEKNGFHSFIISGLRRSGENIGKQVILNKWPEKWTDRYIEQNYFQIDPVSQTALTAEAPFTWSSLQNTRKGNAAERSKRAALNREAQSLHMRDGITIPLRDTYLGKSVVSLATEESMANRHDVVALAFLASSYLNLALSRLEAASDPNQNKKGRSARELSMREKETLTWIALGKTSWETSRILNISERTVHVHLASIRDKLNVSTTTQGVAAALISGAISL